MTKKILITLLVISIFCFNLTAFAFSGTYDNPNLSTELKRANSIISSDSSKNVYFTDSNMHIYMVENLASKAWVDYYTMFPVQDWGIWQSNTMEQIAILNKESVTSGLYCAIGQYTPYELSFTDYLEATKSFTSAHARSNLGTGGANIVGVNVYEVNRSTATLSYIKSFVVNPDTGVWAPRYTRIESNDSISEEDLSFDNDWSGSIGGVGKGVVYDTGVWNSFMSYCFNMLGRGSVVGMTVLAIILGIAIVLRLIRHFAK